MRQKDERARLAPASTQDAAVLVGETEDGMFFEETGVPLRPQLR